MLTITSRMYLIIIDCEMLVLDHTSSNHSVELMSRQTDRVYTCHLGANKKTTKDSAHRLCNKNAAFPCSSIIHLTTNCFIRRNGPMSRRGRQGNAPVPYSRQHHVSFSKRSERKAIGSNIRSTRASATVKTFESIEASGDACPWIIKYYADSQFQKCGGMKQNGHGSSSSRQQHIALVYY